VSGGIDLLLTDVVMPGMNGRELAVRLCERHPGLRILYISGYPDARAADPNGQHPVAGYLQKPFTPRSLAAKVCEVLTS
jgi:YesN/AraC family two-component response regulator